MKKQFILEKAAPIFLERGFHNTSISDIAEACNMSKATLYKFFKSKEDLGLSTGLFLTMELVYQAGISEKDSDMTPREKLNKNIILRIQNFTKRNDFMDGLLFSLTPSQKEQYLPLLHKARFLIFHAFSEAIMQTFSIENEATAWEISLILNGLLREITFWNLKASFAFDNDMIADFIMDCLESIVKQRKGKKPLLTKEQITHFKHLFATESDPLQPISRRSQLLKTLRNQINACYPQELQENLLDAILLLEQEYRKPMPKQFIIDALCLYLSQQKELADVVSSLNEIQS